MGNGPEENIVGSGLVVFQAILKAAMWRLFEQYREIVVGMRRRRAARREFSMLQDFSSNDLKDMGLSRGDLLPLKNGMVVGDETRRPR